MKTAFVVILFLMHFSTFSQTDTKTRMMFSDFIQGTVIFKDGTNATAPLNYDTYEEEMIFKNKDEVLAVASPETVLKIQINNKTFECLDGDVFLEKIDTAGMVVYKRNRNQLLSKGKGTPFGGVSNASSVSTINSIPRGQDKQTKELSANEKFELVADNVF